MITQEDWQVAINILRERVPAPSDVPAWAESAGLDPDALAGIASSIAALSASAMGLDVKIDEESGEVEVDPETLPVLMGLAESILQSLMIGYTVAIGRVSDSDLPDPSKVAHGPENRSGGMTMGFGS